MAIQSMTGFGRGQAGDDNLQVVVEAKSVNHRFRDIRFKMPATLASLEIALKEKISNVFKRGSFDVYVNIKKADHQNRFDDLDEVKIQEYLKKIQRLSQAQGVEIKVNPTEFLRSEFYLEEENEQSKELEGLVLQAFSIAVDELLKSRCQEGEKLISHLKKHRDQFKESFSEVEGKADLFKAHIEEKLKKRVSEYSTEINVEEPRLLQEVVFYLEKMDIHEELNRIHAHLEKLSQLMSGKKEMGRQLDFMIQELNRETNTIGSKSSLKEISDCVVQMKVQLEKMREQGLNLE